MQYEILFKGDRNVHVILVFLKVLLLLKMSRKMAPGTPPTDQRLLTIATPKQVQHILMQTKANSKKQYIIT